MYVLYVTHPGASPGQKNVGWKGMASARSASL